MKTKGGDGLLKILDTLLDEKIVAILRHVPSSKISPTVQALVNGGIKLLEVTMNSEKSLESIYQARNICQGDDVYIGAGTVLNLEMAKEAVDAGAQFLISPNVDISVIKYACENNIEVWPGVMTPTEIVDAWNNGAKAVKLFPASLLGAQYIKDIQAPLENIPIIATGGINLENMHSYFEAGAAAVGIGSQLIQSKLIENDEFEKLKNLAVQFVDKISSGGLQDG